MMGRRAFTLIELLVVLVLLGLTATITSMALHAPPESGDSWRSKLGAARHRAISTGTPVRGWLDSIGRFTAHPGGSIVSDSTIDRIERGATDAR